MPAVLPTSKLLRLHEAIIQIAWLTDADRLIAADAVHRALIAAELVARDGIGNRIGVAVWASLSGAEFQRRLLSHPPFYGDFIDRAALDNWLAVTRDTQHGNPADAAADLRHAQRGDPEERDLYGAALPPYLQFLVEMSSRLEGAAERKKEEIEAEIKSNWPENLAGQSQAIIGYMATILRPPEAKRGGAKPARTGNRRQRKAGKV